MEIKEKNLVPHVYTKCNEGNQLVFHPSGMISQVIAALEYKGIFVLHP